MCNNRALAILVVTERLHGQRLQMRLFLSEHRRYLPLGPSVDALVGPVLFPVIQVRLRLFQALELLALQWRLLRMGYAGFYLAFAIRISPLSSDR